MYMGIESRPDYQTREASVVAKDVVCEVCLRTFRRVGDRKMHKYVS